MSPLVVFILLLVFALALLWADAIFLAFVLGILAVLYFLFTAGTTAGKAITSGGGGLRKGLEKEWQEIEQAKGQYPKSGLELVKEAGGVLSQTLYGGENHKREDERPYHPPVTAWKAPPEERPYHAPTRGINVVDDASEATQRFLKALKKLFD